MPKSISCRIDSFAYTTTGNELTTVLFYQPLPPDRIHHNKFPGLALHTQPRFPIVRRLLGDR